MKIRAEHYTALEAAIVEVVKRYPTAKADAERAGFSAKWYRWAVLRAAQVEGKPGMTWICDTLYAYLNDSHIDTALKAILAGGKS